VEYRREKTREGNVIDYGGLCGIEINGYLVFNIGLEGAAKEDHGSLARRR
jgi:hypothetical protein